MSTINAHRADDIEIVCDNGGGITLMIREGDGCEVTFCHSYTDASQVAYDIKEYLADGTTSGWDGHEPECEIDTDTEAFAEDCRNGGYRVFSVADLMATDTEDVSWFNVQELAAALQR